METLDQNGNPCGCRSTQDHTGGWTVIICARHTTTWVGVPDPFIHTGLTQKNMVVQI